VGFFVFDDIYWKYNIMNRSYSKIRHIQEVNQRLEKRLMSEQVQTTVTQTGENPGTKTKINPPMSKAIPEISGNTPTTTPTITNPFKDQSLLNKFVGKQFNTYTVIEKKNQPDDTGNNSGTFEIEKAYFDEDTKGKVIFDLDGNWTATFDCNVPNYLGITTSTDYWFAAAAPSFLKELTKTFCTTGAGNLSVPKVDYPTP
jgi:hypothetical protein